MIVCRQCRNIEPGQPCEASVGQMALSQRVDVADTDSKGQIKPGPNHHPEMRRIVQKVVDDEVQQVPENGAPGQDDENPDEEVEDRLRPLQHGRPVKVQRRQPTSRSLERSLLRPVGLTVGTNDHPVFRRFFHRRLLRRLLRRSLRGCRCGGAEDVVDVDVGLFLRGGFLAFILLLAVLVLFLVVGRVSRTGWVGVFADVCYGGEVPFASLSPSLFFQHLRSAGTGFAKAARFFSFDSA